MTTEADLTVSFAVCRLKVTRPHYCYYFYPRVLKHSLELPPPLPLPLQLRVRPTGALGETRLLGIVNSQVSLRPATKGAARAGDGGRPWRLFWASPQISFGPSIIESTARGTQERGLTCATIKLL
jgi:hypothetical protein